MGEVEDLRDADIVERFVSFANLDDTIVYVCPAVNPKNPVKFLVSELLSGGRFKTGKLERVGFCCNDI
jgi:hypothetical protein